MATPPPFPGYPKRWAGEAPLGQRRPHEPAAAVFHRLQQRRGELAEPSDGKPFSPLPSNSQASRQGLSKPSAAAFSQLPARWASHQASSPVAAGGT
eukprot:CAMPEP_0115315580 /NCGR_PEP_ID=MMETSP0270-20121206/77659_1 /TAXON_ID=71861 /ORGANISM="Scrippsiella trochoidea, Strain CCMP3099" /LENGTH=95 /DNA_ID=CAMNT_0002734917 /DNA_START=187 /DNA_END=474 /DNA_ORIENTATION=+